MKKLVVYLCTGVMVLSMTACGLGDDNQNDAQTETNQTMEQSGDGAPAGNGATGTGDNAMADIGATQQPTQETASTEDADQNGGTENANWSEDMQAAKTAIVEALGENYWPNTPVSPEMLEGSFGITTDMYDDYMAEVPMINTNVDTLLIVKAKEGKVDAVEEALNIYRENLVNDTMQYPMNVGKIQASRIEKIGNYVCFVQLGADVTEALERGDEAVIAQCQEQNELVIEILNQNLQHQ